MLITCGDCQKKLNIEDDLAGQLGRCPSCNSVIKLPTADQIAGRLPGDPLLEAPVTPDPELLSLAPTDQTGEEQPAPPSGAPPPSTASTAATQPAGAGAIPTDEEGFVLAVPVEDDDAGQARTAPGSIPGQGAVVPRPGETEGDAAYALKDDEGSPVAPRPTPQSAAAAASDLATSLDDILNQLDSDQKGGAPPSTALPPPGSAAAPAEKIITRCPGCGGLLGIETQYAGTMRSCPKCATEIQVPPHSTVLLPDATVSQRAAGPAGPFQPVPDADAADLAPDVDLEAYVAEPVIVSTRAVASYWIILAFLVGATIGFAAGWILAGYYARPGPLGPGPSPPAQVAQPE